jgi:hypothetical protein
VSVEGVAPLFAPWPIAVPWLIVTAIGTTPAPTVVTRTCVGPVPELLEAELELLVVPLLLELAPLLLELAPLLLELAPLLLLVLLLLAPLVLELLLVLLLLVLLLLVLLLLVLLLLVLLLLVLLLLELLAVLPPVLVVVLLPPMPPMPLPPMPLELVALLLTPLPVLLVEPVAPPAPDPPLEHADIAAVVRMAIDEVRRNERVCMGAHPTVGCATGRRQTCDVTSASATRSLDYMQEPSAVGVAPMHVLPVWQSLVTAQVSPVRCARLAVNVRYAE